jgi:hypothetical protein
MVRRVLRRQFDDDADDYDPKYPGKRVFKDGRGPRVPLYMTDSASRRFVPLMDARARTHQATIDSYRLTDRQAAAHRPHEATANLSDADIRAARSRSEHAREQWIRRMQDQWSEPIGGLPRKPPNGNGNSDDGDDRNRDDDSDPRSASERARDAWIERQSNAWHDPVGRGAYAGPNPAHAYSGPSDYARGAGRRKTASVRGAATRPSRSRPPAARRHGRARPTRATTARGPTPSTATAFRLTGKGDGAAKAGTKPRLGRRPVQGVDYDGPRCPDRRRICKGRAVG